MRDLSELFGEIANATQTLSSVICVVHETRDPPKFASPMLRDPIPDVGQLVDSNFSQLIMQVNNRNPSVHDGAIMIGVQDDGKLFVTGWSYRLFPPATDLPASANRGSAFNSCHAMSVVQNVQCVFLLAKGECLRFERGRITLVFPFTPTSA